jgi:hypothetical protein
MSEQLTCPDLCVAIHGAKPHQVRALYHAGKIPGERCGRYLIFRRADIESIRTALIEHGYLKTPAEVLA